MIDPERKRQAAETLARHLSGKGPFAQADPESFAGWHFVPCEEWLLVHTSGGYGGPVQHLVREDFAFTFSLAEHSYESALAAARAAHAQPARRRRWWWPFGRG